MRRMSTIQHNSDWPDEGRQNLLEPPQFRLRTLMIVTAACAGLFALFSVVSLVVSAFIVFFLVLIAAHVIGNAVGTRLRDGALQRQTHTQHPPDSLPRPQQGNQPQRLRESTAVDRRTIVFSAVGAITGGTLGGVLLSAVNWTNITPPAAVLATGSSAILGGLATFLATCFLTTIRCALREATSEHSK
jgi:hypothetical protein